ESTGNSLITDSPAPRLSQPPIKGKPTHRGGGHVSPSLLESGLLVLSLTVFLDDVLGRDLGLEDLTAHRGQNSGTEGIEHLGFRTQGLDHPLPALNPEATRQRVPGPGPLDDAEVNAEGRRLISMIDPDGAVLLGGNMEQSEGCRPVRRGDAVALDGDGKLVTHDAILPGDLHLERRG